MEDKSKMEMKSNVIKATLSFVVIMFIAFILASYLINNEFRYTIDTKILKKEITEDVSSTIEIKSDDKPYIHAFSKYITVLSKDILYIYGQDAVNLSKIDMNITTPYMSSSDKYLAIAEYGGNKLYLISDLMKKWEKDVDGEIYRVSVNNKGYVSVLLKNTTYKSIVVIYDSEGNEMFKTYLAQNYAICSEISNNNKYLAIGEIDYSGTVVKSVVKIVAISEVREKSKNSIINTYESESNRILTNIKFNNKNQAICSFDSYVQKVTYKSDQRVYDISNNDLFVDVNLLDNMVIIEKETSGLFSYQYQLNVKSTIGKSDCLYILDNDVPKKLKISNNLICINLANEVRILNSSGWLLKKYTTRSEIKDIVVGENIVGIVYNNKIEVINI